MGHQMEDLFEPRVSHVDGQAKRVLSENACDYATTVSPHISAVCELRPRDKLETGRKMTFLISLKFTNVGQNPHRRSTSVESHAVKPANSLPLTHIPNHVGMAPASSTRERQQIRPRQKSDIVNTLKCHAASTMLILAICPPVNQVKANIIRQSLEDLTRASMEGDFFAIMIPNYQGKWDSFDGNAFSCDEVWNKMMASASGARQRYHEVDLITGINAAIGFLTTGRGKASPCPTVLVVSDAVKLGRAGANSPFLQTAIENVTIHTFGLGMRHEPDVLIELASRTKAVYTYIKDWMALPESLVSCLRSVQDMLLADVRLRLRIEDSSPATIQRGEGAHLMSLRSGGREMAISLGNLRLSDQRDIAIHLSTGPKSSSTNPNDEEFDVDDAATARKQKVGDEPGGLVRFHVDLRWRNTTCRHVSVLNSRPLFVQFPTDVSQAESHPSTNIQAVLPLSAITQRRFELSIVNMLVGVLTYISSGQSSKASALIAHIDHVLRALCDSVTSVSSSICMSKEGSCPCYLKADDDALVCYGWQNGPTGSTCLIDRSQNRLQSTNGNFTAAILKEVQTWSVWIHYPSIFNLDTRKAVLQAISAISFQRAFTTVTPVTSLLADSTLASH